MRTLKRKLLWAIGKNNLLKKHTILISSYALTDPYLCGEVDRPKGLLVLSPSVKRGGLNEFLASFIHECLHVFLKTSNEKLVGRLEKLVWKDMSSNEKAVLFIFLAENAMWD